MLNKVTPLPVKIPPVKPFDFQTSEHRHNRFDCIVPSGLKKKDLENPDLWVNVARTMRQFDEIRAISDDHKVVWDLICTFSHGTDARLVVKNETILDGENIDCDSLSNYKIVLRGVKKQSVIHKKTGDVLKDGFAKLSEAQKWLEEYEIALRG